MSDPATPRELRRIRAEDRVTLRDLRRTRTRRRLGDVEWFDVAYRAYLVGFVGIVAVVVVSDALSGLLGDDVTVASWVERGPAVLGIVVAVALALGLRSGAEGGPVSIEVADVRHVLLAPIRRRAVMALPISQRLRTVMFALAVVGAVLAQLVARELEASRGGWAAAGALYGAVVGAVFVTSAVVAHAVALARWTASLLGAVVMVWQGAAAWSVWTGNGSSLARLGPADPAGSIALWGVRQRAVDWIALGAVAAAILVSVALGGRLRVEALTRRGQLVSQLRFAATVQDLRTVVLLRRQLRAEVPRSRPWADFVLAPRRPPAARRRWRHPTTHAPTPGRTRPSTAVWGRGVSSLRRLPAPRVARIAALALLAGAAGSLTVSSSPLFGLALLAALFLLGLEVIEPLSQEVDRPSLTTRLPVERGWLFAHHLVAPAALLAIVALLGVVGTAAVEPRHVPAAAVLAIPVAFAGASGPVVAAVRDAPRPSGVGGRTLAGGSDSVLVPPEFAGFNSVVTALVPLASSAAGVAPVLAMRAAPTAGTAARAVVGVALFLAAVVVWVRRRDDWARAVRAFVAEGQAAR